MNIEKNAVDNLNATITISISKDDYKPKFDKELKKLASQASMKGFRKGKTPASVVRKMYGKRVMVDVVNETLQTALSDYLKTEELDIMGQPIPSDDQDGDLNFDPNNFEDYEFKFDIGMAPEFEIEGVSDKDTYDVFKVKVDDATLDEELTVARKKLGTQEHPDGQVQEKDIITIQADELSGKRRKKDGWATEFTVMVDTLSDEYKDAVLKMNKGDEFSFDIYKLENDRTEDYVKKYLLNIKDNDSEDGEAPEIGNDFKGKITDLSRLKEAELDQEFFDKYFGEGEVSSEKEAKEKIAENIAKHYDNQAMQVMYRNIMDKLVADTKVELPETFLKKWLKMTNEKLSDEEIDKDFQGFIDNTKWNLIKSKLAKKFEVEVTSDDVKNAMSNKIMGYMRQYGMDPSQMDGIMQNLMQNQEEVNRTYEELHAEKVFAKIGETVKKKEVKITLEKFNDFVKELNSKQEGA